MFTIVNAIYNCSHSRILWLAFLEQGKVGGLVHAESK